MKWKTNGKRFLALLLTAVLLLSVCPVTASAEETDGLCPHHTEHDENCGYVQGSPCTHEHVGTCYKWEKNCTHQHVATCYEWVKNCTHNHFLTCYSDGVRPAEGEEKQADTCTHQCSEDTGCLTRGEKICTHECSEASGCLIRGEEECKHKHMATECGYVEGHDCEYQCDICAVQAMIDALPYATDITVENAAEVKAAITAIDTAIEDASIPKTELTMTHYDAVKRVLETIGNTESSQQAELSQITLAAPKASTTYTLYARAVVVDSNNKIVGFDMLPSKNWSGTTNESSSYAGPWTWSATGSQYKATTTTTGTHVNTFPYIKYPTYLYDTTGYTYKGWKSSSISIDLPGNAIGSLNSNQTSSYFYENTYASTKQTIAVANATGTYLWYVFQANTPTTYSYNVTHVYRTNGNVDGSTTTTVSKVASGTTVNANSITKAPTYKGNTYTYTSASPASAVITNNNTTFTLYYDRTVQTAPDKPTDGQVNALLKDGAVKIDCINSNVTHADKVYSLQAGTYTIGDVQGSAAGYTCTVTVNDAAPYVTQYNTGMNVTHTLSPETQTPKSITLEYKDGAWAVQAGTAPVTFTVICTDKAEELDATLTLKKVFKGIDASQIPEGFALNYSIKKSNADSPYLTGTLDKTTATISSDDDGNPTWSWVISGLKSSGSGTNIQNNVTVTEQNADITDYQLKQDGLSFALGDAFTAGSRTITNTYTQNQPSTNWSGLIITKTASPSGTVKPGDTITYTITVKNETGKALKNITVSEKLDENLTFANATPSSQYDKDKGVWTIDTLANNGTAILTITATVNNGVENGTKIANTAAITGAEDSDGGKPGENEKPGDSADVTVTIPQETPALTVTKTADKTEVAPGEPVTYTIRVKNNTSETISGIVLKDTLPEGASIESALGATSTTAYNVITFEVFDLAANEEKTFTLAVKYADVTASVTKTNTATATSGDKDYTGTADVTVKPADTPTAPDWGNLKITKTADKTEVKPGDTVVYTITVENQTGKDLNDVIISEKLDTNLTFVSATPGDLYNSTDNAWTIPILENDITARLTITATVSEKASGKIPNTVTVTGAKTEDGDALPEDGQPADSVDITVKPDEPVKPDWDKLTISKSANPKAVKRGETITYTIRVQNNTGMNLDTVTVQETPDSNLTVTGHSQGAAYDAEKNVWTITGLANGAEAKLTVTATVNADTTASVVWNTVSITSASAGGGETLTGKPSDSISVVVTDPKPTAPEPETDWDGLTLKKTANRSSVRPGKTITYTLTVTNKTGKDLTDIAVSEKLDANLTFVSSSGDGKYDVKTGEWTIGKLENGGKATLTLKATVKTGLKDGTVIKNTACITDAGAENGDTLPTDAQPSGSANVTVSNKISVIPQTGDTSSIGLWIGVMVACAVVLGVVLIFTVKKKKTR